MAATTSPGTHSVDGDSSKEILDSNLYTMVKSIEQVYLEVKRKYKLKKNAHLASGGMIDTKGVGTSDVDIVFMTKTKEEYLNLDDLFSGATKEPREDKNRCYYHFKHGGRDVSVCASNDESVMRSVTHRKNELMLNKFPLVTSAAIVYKLNGMKTEPAYVRALGIEISEDAEAYEVMLMNSAKLKKIAKLREKEIQRIYSGSI